MKKLIIGVIITLPFYVVGKYINDNFISGWFAGIIAFAVQQVLNAEKE